MLRLGKTVTALGIDPAFLRAATRDSVLPSEVVSRRPGRHRRFWPDDLLWIVLTHALVTRGARVRPAREHARTVVAELFPPGSRPSRAAIAARLAERPMLIRVGRTDAPSIDLAALAAQLFHPKGFP
jgi:hypothetical protein